MGKGLLFWLVGPESTHHISMICGYREGQAQRVLMCWYTTIYILAPASPRSNANGERRPNIGAVGRASRWVFDSGVSRQGSEEKVRCRASRQAHLKLMGWTPKICSTTASQWEAIIEEFLRLYNPPSSRSFSVHNAAQSPSDRTRPAHGDSVGP